MRVPPPPPLASAAVVLALGAASIALFQACDRAASGADSGAVGADGAELRSEAGTFTRANVLEAMGACALDTARAFQKKADALASAARAAEADDAQRKAAQAAFADAMATWQRAELMQFGPLAPKGSPGGQELREPIYSFPLVSRCLVEQTLASKGYADPTFGSLSLVSTRGLGAAEYLLHYEGADNACAPSSSINASGAWAALGGAEIRARKNAYARVVADDVAARAKALVATWDGGFLEGFTRAGRGSAVYPSDQAAFNAVMDGLFYVVDDLKDLKIGKPLGLYDCQKAPCLDGLEAPYSRLGRAHAKANLAGFQALFFGCGEGGKGLGFDDLLAGTGASAAAEATLGALRDCERTLDAIPGALEDAVTQSPDAVRAFHTALRKLAEVLRNQVLPALSLTVPPRVEGDND